MWPKLTWNKLGFNQFGRRNNKSRSVDETNPFNHWAEASAADYLQKQGLRLKERNYRCKSGEIDLIMSHRDCDLIFVEVRYRKQNRYGSAMESVDYTKQSKLIKAAQHYLQHNNKVDQARCRFDVVAIELDASDRTGEPIVQWVENAFSV